MKQPLGVTIGCLLMLGPGAASPALCAEVLQRGPFLQIATPESITVRWRTDVVCEGVVRYGTQSNELVFSTTDPSPTTEHEVRLSGLMPATQYFYSVGSFTNTLVEGPDFNFVTPPLPGQSQPTRVWVIGDAGQTMNEDQVRVRNAYYRHTGSRRTDVWIALGDNAYYNGNDSEYQTNFFDIYLKLLPQTAIWSALGNHETYSVTPAGRHPYFDIFSFPTNGEAGGVASGVEEYYSFDHANIHFICLDSTMSDPATNGAMADWLRADLAANKSDWIIAFWHHPPYTKGIHDSDTEWESIAMRQNMLPILERHGVDLVLSGHSHIYERSYLLRGHYGDSSTLQPEMILDQGSGREKDTGPYVKPTSGPDAGQGTVYAEVGSSGYVRSRVGYHPAMFFSELQLGSLVLDINSNRLDATFLRETGAIDDSFTIIKSEPAPLRLLDITVNNGNVILRWKSMRGQSYRMERSESWPTLNWQPASDPITAVGATTAWTNTVSAGPMCIYRVVEVPAPLPAGPAKPAPPGVESTKREQRTETSLSAIGERLRPALPQHPDEKRRGAFKWVSEGVVCDTTYWRRRIQTVSCSRSTWRLAIKTLSMVWGPALRR